MSHRKVSSEKHWRGKRKALSKKLRRQNPFPSVILLKTQYRYNHSRIPVLELVMIISISLFPSLCANCTKLHKRHHLQNEPLTYFSSSILTSRLWTIKQECLGETGCFPHYLSGLSLCTASSSCSQWHFKGPRKLPCSCLTSQGSGFYRSISRWGFQNSPSSSFSGKIPTRKKESKHFTYWFWTQCPWWSQVMVLKLSSGSAACSKSASTLIPLIHCWDPHLDSDCLSPQACQPTKPEVTPLEDLNSGFRSH